MGVMQCPRVISSHYGKQPIVQAITGSLFNYKPDECLKHSYFTRVSLAFSCCFDIIYIVLGVRSLIMCLF